MRILALLFSWSKDTQINPNYTHLNDDGRENKNDSFCSKCIYIFFKKTSHLFCSSMMVGKHWCKVISDPGMLSWIESPGSG